MSKIIEEDASSDLNSDNNNENDINDSNSKVHYPFKNSKSQDIRIKNFNTMIISGNDTP